MMQLEMQTPGRLFENYTVFNRKHFAVSKEQLFGLFIMTQAKNKNYSRCDFFIFENGAN